MILNLTQHQATPDQVVHGVVDLPAPERAMLTRLLTVDALPTRAEIIVRCNEIAKIAAEVIDSNPDATAYEPCQAMIGGAPWMMGALENALIGRGITAVYAFSVRESVEQLQPDGSVKKFTMFRHAGFV